MLSVDEVGAASKGTLEASGSGDEFDLGAAVTPTPSTPKEDWPLIGSMRPQTRLMKRYRSQRSESHWKRLFYYKALPLAVFALLVVIVTTLAGGSRFGRFWTGKSGHHNDDGHLQPDTGNDGIDSDTDNWLQPETVRNPNGRGWIPTAPLDPTNAITLTIAVSQRNIESFHDRVYEISDPDSKRYGKHMSYDEVHEWLRPAAASVDAIYKWLNGAGIAVDNIEALTPNSDYLKVRTTVAMANKLLNAEFYTWTHLKSTLTAIRVKNSYSLPKHVLKHIDFMSPTLRFPFVGRSHTQEHTSQGVTLKEDGSLKHDSFSTVNPNRLAKLYHTESETEEYTKKSALLKADYTKADDWNQVVAAFLDENYLDSDIDSFLSKYGLEKQPLSRYPKSRDNKQHAGTEGTLDTEYMLAMGRSVPTIFWYSAEDTYFIGTLKQIHESKTKVHTVSFSYGVDEEDAGKSYVTRANTDFGKGAAMGISFFASTGDSGANDEDKGELIDGMYDSQFPATCMYVTAVGGTVGGSPQQSWQSSTNEEAWPGTGGGFSVYLKQPKYQKEVVSQYLDKMGVGNLPPKQRFHSSMNGFPDIAAQAQSYAVVRNGKVSSMGGTSAAAPAVAGMFARVNKERVARGWRPLGWLNPALYKLAPRLSEFFNDVSKGQQMNRVDGHSHEKGFQATTGWDPMTGLGTPKFPKLLEYLVFLGDKQNDKLKKHQ